MYLNNIKLTVLPISFIIASFFCYSQNANLDSIIKQQMALYHLPGLAACTITDGKISWSGYYGFQNIELKKPVTKQTLFMLASTSKTITAAALMQLYGEGKFKMNDDINKYLPFRVINPMNSSMVITFGMLLRHRSSIRDNVEYLGPLWSANNGDPVLPLRQFLEDYLSAGGKNYNATKNFYNEKPDSAYHYSNVGIALIGYLVERIARMPFDQYCKKNIFTPLQMDNTAWFLKDLDSNQVAMPYRYSFSLNQYVKYGFGGYPDYPAGELRTSAEQLADFLIAWTQNGKFKDKRVFKADAIQLITPDDIRLGFYTWFLYGTDEGTILYDHNGNDNGVFTAMLFNPKNKKGVIILVNGEIDVLSRLRSIINAIYDSIP
jgi:CubicO group peptidase (beta-lactamase class C family)